MLIPSPRQLPLPFWILNIFTLMKFYKLLNWLLQSITNVLIVAPGAYIGKHFCPHFTNIIDKLDCLSLASLSSPSLMFESKAGTYISGHTLRCSSYFMVGS